MDPSDWAVIKGSAFLNYFASTNGTLWDAHNVLLFVSLPAFALCAFDVLKLRSAWFEIAALVVPVGMAFAAPTVFFLPVWATYAVIIIMLGKVVSNGNSFDDTRALRETRAIVMFLTCVCIYSIDFVDIFPRSLGKTELYGYSLMDVGVGGVTLVTSMNRSIKISSDRCLYDRLYLAITKGWPSMVLGVSRFFTVKAADHYVSSSEYGVHWNFFFTVFVVSVLAALVPPRASYGVKVGMVIGALFVPALVQSSESLEWFFFFGERSTGFIAANREGIVSCFGYFALHIIGSLLAPFVQTSGLKRLLTLTAVFYTFMYFQLFFGFQPSRRLANASYVIVTVTITLVLLSLLKIIQTCSPNRPHMPMFIQGINWNPLLYFLLANLLSGITNLTLQTLFLEQRAAIALNILYIICLGLLGLIFAHIKTRLDSPYKQV